MSYDSNPYYDYMARCLADKFKHINSSILNDQYKNVIIVIDNNKLTLYKLDPIAMKYFSFSYRGMICNSEQWEYFKECLDVVNDGLLETNKKLLGFIKLAKIKISQNHKGLIDPPEPHTNIFKLVLYYGKCKKTYIFRTEEKLIDYFENMIKTY